MALTTAQEALLLAVLRDRFPDDTGDLLALRVIRFMVRNNPSNAQKTAIQAVVNDYLAARDAQLAAFDAQAVATKATIQTDRDSAATIGGAL
jgi:hypothetical protein